MINTEAVKILVTTLRDSFQSPRREDQMKFITSIIDHISTKATGIISPSDVESCLARLRSIAGTGPRDRERVRFAVLSAFDTPKVRYDSLRSVYKVESIASDHDEGCDSASRKISVFRDRFDLVKQRVLRTMPGLVLTPIEA